MLAQDTVNGLHLGERIDDVGVTPLEKLDNPAVRSFNTAKLGHLVRNVLTCYNMLRLNMKIRLEESRDMR